MFRFSLIHFFRNFKKDLVYSLINFFGLTIGILVAILTGYYVFYKFSYDTFVDDHKNIYRIEMKETFSTYTNYVEMSNDDFGGLLKSEIPEIKDAFIFFPAMNIQVFSEEKRIALDNWSIVNPIFFDLYNIKMLKGKLASSESDVKYMYLTKSMAERYFPNEDPINKPLSFQGREKPSFIIKGIIEDFPKNSHLSTTAIVADSPINGNNFDINETLANYQYLYIQLHENAKIETVIDKFQAVKDKHLSKILEKRESDLEITATRLSNIIFNEKNFFRDTHTDNKRTLYFFILIATTVVFISIINYINLMLAKYSFRLREIGVRKTLGATKFSLFIRYLTESSLFILISLIFATLIFITILPEFNLHTGIDLTQSRVSLLSLFSIIPFFFLISIVAGFYPSLVIAGMKTTEILKGKSTNKSKVLRNIFITVQIVFSIILFIGSIIIFMQMRYINNKDKGFDYSNVMAFEFYNYGDNMPTTEQICQDLEKSAYIDIVGTSTKIPGDDIVSGECLVESFGKAKIVRSGFMNINNGYIPMMKMKLLAGRNFSSDYKADTLKVIINSAFASRFDSPQNLIGEYMKFAGAAGGEGPYMNSFEIIGVVDDFNIRSLYEKVQPMVLFSLPFAPNFYHIKYSEDNFKEIKTFAEKTFKEENAVMGATFYDLETIVKDMYKSEDFLSKMTLILSLLSILLSVIGVFGLTAFMIRNNMKMISIRKIHGAGLRNIFSLLFHQYTIVVIFANIIALPVSWYLFSKWLARFAYRIEIPFWIFPTGAFASFVIISLSIIYHVKVLHKTNPVKFLRSE